MTTTRDGKPLGRESNHCDGCHRPYIAYDPWYRIGDPRIFCSQACLSANPHETRAEYERGYADGFMWAVEKQLPMLIRQALREEREVRRYDR